MLDFLNPIKGFGVTFGTIKSGLKVYFIPKDTQNPYEVLADKGGQKALSELGGSVVVSKAERPILPQTAVLSDIKGPYVYVVGTGGTDLLPGADLGDAGL